MVPSTAMATIAMASVVASETCEAHKAEYCFSTSVFGLGLVDHDTKSQNPSR